MNLKIFVITFLLLTIQELKCQEDIQVPPEAAETMETADSGVDQIDANDVEREDLMGEDELKDLEKMGGLDGLPEIEDLPNLGGKMPDPEKVI